MKLRDTINLCNAEAMMSTNRSTNNNSQAILKLASHSVQEARTMKIIAVLALAFVPASFAAVRLHL